MTEFFAPLASHPPAWKPIRPAWAVGSLTLRLPQIARSYQHDLTLLQREMLATYATLETFTNRPRVLDVDDAIFMARGGKSAAHLARRCASIICGNEYLAEHFRQWNAHVTIVPIAVDVSRFRPAPSGRVANGLSIGWIGTSGSFKYLHEIEEALRTVLELRPAVSFKVIADRPPTFRRLPNERVEFLRWTRDGEVPQTQSMSLGIMPLTDGGWERGKCSYKMLQDMRRLTGGRDTGRNEHASALTWCGSAGLAAATRADWVDALLALLDDSALREQMGRVGRAVVETHFSVEAVAPRLADALKRAG